MVAYPSGMDIGRIGAMIRVHIWIWQEHHRSDFDLLGGCLEEKKPT